MLNNLEKHLHRAEQFCVSPLPAGTRTEQGREIIRRCEEREKRLEQEALKAEREGDEDGCWLAMAARAENRRVIEQITRDLNRISTTHVKRTVNQ